MAIKSYDDSFDGIDRFGRFDGDFFGQFERLFDEMRSMYGLDRYDHDGRGVDNRVRMGWGDAATNLEMADGEYVFVMDLPGFEREDIDLTLEDDRLSVLAVHEAGDDSSRRSRRVRNSVRIPADIHEDEISAVYRNGVLEVHLPIVDDEADDARHIDIQG